MGLFYLILGGLEKRKNTWSTSGSNVIEKSLFNCVPFFIQLNSNINNHSLLLSIAWTRCVQLRMSMWCFAFTLLERLDREWPSSAHIAILCIWEQEGERVIASNAPFLSFSLYRICPFGWTGLHVLSDMFQTQAGGICTAPCTVRLHISIWLC